MLITQLTNGGREPRCLLNDDGAHRFVVGVVGEFAETIEERAEAAREILIGEFVANRLDRVEETLIDCSGVFLADRRAQTSLQRGVDRARNGRDADTRTDKARASDVLRSRWRNARDLPVVSRCRCIREVVTCDLQRRLTHLNRGVTDVESAIDTHDAFLAALAAKFNCEDRWWRQPSHRAQRGHAARRRLFARALNELSG